jgi:hypothetical protein
MALSLSHMALIPWWCTGLWLSRDVLLIGMSYRAAAIAAKGRDHAVAGKFFVKMILWLYF